MNRRFFLRSAGGLLLAAPFLPSLRSRTARADALPLPRRSIIFHTPCGCITTRWFPKVEHGPLDASALQGTSLEALTPFVKKLLVPRGLRAINQYPTCQSVDPTDQSMASKLTCSLMTEGNARYATAPSLDHVIARQINPVSKDPLVLSVGKLTTNVKDVLSYTADLPFPAIVSPAKVYAGLSGASASQKAERERLRLRKQSILDAVRDDLDSYQRLNMSKSDRNRVGAWLDLLRDTEAMPASTCDENAVGINEASAAAASESSANPDAFTLGGDAMMKLMALTLLCDNNRSLVFSYPAYAKFDWDGIHHAYDQTGLSHRTGDFTVGGKCVAGVIDMLLEIDRWYAGKFAKLVALLDSLPEGDGTLLDQTATVWLNQFSDGAASNLNNLPIVIAGSAGGYLKQGAAVNVEGSPIGVGNSEASCPAEGGYVDTGSKGGNVPINKLYVTLMNALGCKATDGGPVTSFGTLDGLTKDLGITDPGELSALRA